MTRLLAALLRATRDLRDLDQRWALLREAAPQDIEQAREVLRLIVERGYNRGRSDLLERLEQLVTDREG